jgi:preprotein translocase subunit SecA
MIPLPQLMTNYLKIRSHSLRTFLIQKVNEINKFSNDYCNLSDSILLRYFEEIKGMVKSAIKPEVIEVQLFAIIREFARRTVKMYPYDVQLLAALVVRRGKIIQMNTGEGKTLVAPFYAIVEKLYGRQVVVVTPNDYLSYRDAVWMRPLYQAFGVSVSSVQPWYNTEEKQQAYRADVIYVSTQQIVFDYLRKHHSLTYTSDFLIPQETLIIDEIDNVLLDQGLTPYALVNIINFRSSVFSIVDNYVSRFEKDLDFRATPKIKEIEFTDSGYEKLSLFSTEIQIPYAEFLFYTKCALSSYHLYENEKDYIVENNKIVVIDNYSGRPHYGSSFPFGIQQFIEQKEGLPLTRPLTTINQITLQGFVKRFNHVAGMSGSAIHDAIEFKVIYNLDVVPIPPNKPCIRENYEDIFFRTKREQINAVVNEAEDCIGLGRPVLIGAINIEDAQSIASVCKTRGLNYRLLTAKNHFEEAQIIAEAGQAGRITIAALMAGRGVDIKLDDEARQSGGLHVIGVGRNEARRLDEQLQGRSARQGDPGSSRFIISLEDDLMKIHGSERISKLMERIGFAEGEVIENPWVTRSIKNAQGKLTLLRFHQRQAALIFDQYLNRTREIVFSRRETMAQKDTYSYEIDTLIQRCVNQICTSTSSELPDKLHKISNNFDLLIGPQMWHLSQHDPKGFSEAFKNFLHQVFDKRRQEAGSYAEARERLILIRSIDYCWSLFIDQTQNLFESFIFTGAQQSRFEILAEMSHKFLGESEKLSNEIDQVTLFYLMHIHDIQILQEIKYWRGLGVSYGMKGDSSLDDGIECPYHYLSIYDKKSEDIPLLPAAEQKILGSGRPVFKRRFSDYLQDYLTGLCTREIPQSAIEQIKTILEHFSTFIDSHNIDLERAFDAVSQYMKSLKIQGVGFVNRSKQQEIILDFFKYLQKQKVISRQSPITVKQNITRKLGYTFNTLKNPLFIFQMMIIVGVFVGYRYISSLPIPFLDCKSNPFQQLPIPHFLLRLFDELLLSDALTHLSLGVLGIIPFISTRLLGKAIARGEWRFESPVIYLPLTFIESFFISLFLSSSIENCQVLFWYHKIIMFSSIFIVSYFITFLLWIVQYTEFISGLQLVILGNAFIVLYRELVTRILPNFSSAIWIWLPLAMIIPALFVLYRKASKVSFNIVRVGRFDLKAGELRNTTTTIHLDTMSDGYHYLFAFIIVIFLSFWFARFSQVIPKAFLQSINILNIQYWQLIMYLFVVYWVIYKRARNKLAPENIKAFLQNRDSFIQDAQDWQEAPSFIQSKITKKIFTNLIFETTIILCLMSSVSASFLGSYQIGVEYTLYITTLTALGIYLLFFVARQIVAIFSETATSAILSIPPPVEEDEELSWIRKKYNLIREKYGFIGFLILLAGLFQFIDYMIKIIIWLLKIIF